MSSNFRLGIDIGSTTAKAVLTDAQGTILYGTYLRHNARIFATLDTILEEIRERFGSDLLISVLFTGTAGMGIAERTGIPFVQEVSASAAVIRHSMPDVRTYIDLGGEDAKIIFFDDHLRPDIRMNGNCAGGTGAFIDQMAVLLNIPVEELSDEAAKKTTTYAIASRCGVFAKTDIQNLISRDVSSANIAASIYRAVAFQIISSLARGVEIVPKLLFAGGPFYYQPELKRTFLEIIGFDESCAVDPTLTDPELTPDRIPAAGAALRAADEGVTYRLEELIAEVERSKGVNVLKSSTLEPLFADSEEHARWMEQKSSYRIQTAEFREIADEKSFLGIDSGSTTTKVVLIDKDGRLCFSHYAPNNGKPVEAVLNGLERLREEAERAGVVLDLGRTAVTGYGEDLIRFAFSLDEGHVETLAHFRGAAFFEPEVSFILDIGGQDMKAIFVRNRVVNNIELNESCSSGSGSFIQTRSGIVRINVFR